MMNNSEGPKRHRPSQRKIELDLYFLPDRMPKSLRYPLDAVGGPDALIKLDQAEGHLSPSSDSSKGWQISLTVCPPGEGHFMGIDLSIAEAKRLVKVLDYVIKWQEDLKARAEAPAKPTKKDQAKNKKAKKEKASSKRPEKIKAKKKGRS
jgi:hypothetical protein